MTLLLILYSFSCGGIAGALLYERRPGYCLVLWGMVSFNLCLVLGWKMFTHFHPEAAWPFA